MQLPSSTLLAGLGLALFAGQVAAVGDKPTPEERQQLKMLAEEQRQQRIHIEMPKPTYINVALPPAKYLTPPPGQQKAEVIRICKSQFGTEDLEKCGEAINKIKRALV
ncbi:hypothetical protein CKAH01_06754 [Colletotrichum kahawae]|uniref:Uncharacterized protein n=1 Tax=Colletotrichum kahawae TaxID=34407 RepID=A0AAD9Y725_COLKA|nr:hypothetical protein CKAH01_06754 [Colletotrichum kahawae]